MRKKVDDPPGKLFREYYIGNSFIQVFEYERTPDEVQAILNRMARIAASSYIATREVQAA